VHLEQVDEVARVHDADLAADLRDGHVGRAQVFLRLVEPDRLQILVRGVARVAAEQLLEIEFADRVAQGQIVERHALGVVVGQVAPRLLDVLRRAQPVALHVRVADRLDHDLREKARGVDVGGQRALRPAVERDERAQHLADAVVGRERDHRALLVLRLEDVVVGRARRAVEVHPQDAPVARLGRGAVELRVLAVNPEQLVRQDRVGLAAVVQKALARERVFDEIGGQALAPRVVSAVRDKVAQLLYVEDGILRRLARRDRQPDRFWVKIQVVAQFDRAHGNSSLWQESVIIKQQQIVQFFFLPL